MLEPLDIAGGYAAGPGQFGTIKNTAPVFQTCRETFQTQYFGQYSNLNGSMIYVRNTNKSIEDILNFIKCFENASEIKNGAEFGIVKNYETYIHIKPNWWQSQHLRFSLFTALLRASNNYPDLECAMQFETYLKTTIYAISKFMEGFNYCYTNHDQWYKTFNNIEEVDHVLTIDIESVFDKNIIKKAKTIDDIFKKYSQSEVKRIAELCQLLTK